MDGRALYLDLMKKCVTDSIYTREPYTFDVPVKPRTFFKRKLVEAFNRRGIQLIRRKAGWRYPLVGHTMIGLKRLDNLQSCIERVLADNVHGDLIETGVWRGGATIFMRAILKAHNVANRCVWVSDSFEGLPPPNPERYPADAGDTIHRDDVLRVSIEEVKANFATYGLLDKQVVFLQGYFRDTLPPIADKQWAVIRMDGDMYESTMDAFTNLYPNLSVGGYVIIDDYNRPGCRQAVHDYRDANGIREEIRATDSCEVYWRKGQAKH